MTKSPTRLLLIRHGETAWNAVGRVQGQLDVPLSSTGMWQAGRLAQRLAQQREHEPIHAVIASTLARAWLTARPLAESLGLEVQPEDRLRERSFGIFEGHTMEEISSKWPSEFMSWRARDPAWPIPDGESAQRFIDRTLAALTDLTHAWAGRTVALVVHGGVLDVAYRHARGLSWDAPRQHAMLNAAINRMDSTAAPLNMRVVDWGDVAHLDAEDAGPIRDEAAA
jgi:2,3-bisphosphoglycerate-dependent phosphoglycerate mutase